MLQYQMKIPIYITSRHMAWGNVKNINIKSCISEIYETKGFQTVYRYRLSKSVNILEETLTGATRRLNWMVPAK